MHPFVVSPRLPLYARVAAAPMRACTGIGGACGSVYVDYLTWDGTPNVTLTRPADGGTLWRRAWVNGVDNFHGWAFEPYRLVHDEGVGLLIQGTREWTDYRVSADVTPHMVASAGIAARVQGMRRYYALLLSRDEAGGLSKVRLVKALDGTKVLAEADFQWAFGAMYDLALDVVGETVRGYVGGKMVFEVEDAERPLEGGGVALVCEEGRTATYVVKVQPLS